MRRVLFAAVLACSALAIPTAAVDAAPAGFTDEEVADVDSLTTIEGLPDGRVVVLEKTGRVLRIDARSDTPVVTVLAEFTDVCTRSERGLLGIAIDPAYTTSGFVYVYRTVQAPSSPGGCVNRVSRFAMGEDALDITGERILVDRISSVAGNHNGGDVEVGADGFLYISVGDAGRDPRGDSGSAGANDAGQDLSLLNGKILRVDRSTGFAAPGNPFTGAGSADCRVRGNSSATPTSACREIYAYGLRNPFRLAFDQGLPVRFHINDVGQGTREEVNNGVLGANYGWPMREGRCPQGQNPPCAGPGAGLVDPITDYDHSNGRFITAGAFVTGGAWPEQYDRAYLAADGATGTTWVWRGGADLAASEVFQTVFAPTDMVFVSTATESVFWYVQQDGEVHRVTVDPASPQGPDGNGLRQASRLRFR